ncbi:MAG: helix-turn-helix domain-containing protein [Asticcacaulis sp.]|nr:helix-turn-helix domain-containing protein [Asticcacaulis sp.]
MDVQSLIGWNVKRLRKAVGLSQEELALRVEIVDQSYISGVEGGRRNPTAVLLYLLAAALGTEVGELFSVANVPSKITAGPVKIKSTRSKKDLI